MSSTFTVYGFDCKNQERFTVTGNYEHHGRGAAPVSGFSKMLDAPDWIILSDNEITDEEAVYATEFYKFRKHHDENS